jgi:hypothetical protein
MTTNGEGERLYGQTAYTAAAVTVWPHASTPLTGSRGIGDQRGRLAALAADSLTVAA